MFFIEPHPSLCPPPRSQLWAGVGYFSLVVAVIVNGNDKSTPSLPNASWGGCFSLSHCCHWQWQQCIWVYTTTFPWRRTFKLYASLLSWLSSLFDNPDHLDNLGLMPYQRQIVAVGKSRPFFTHAFNHSFFSFLSVGKPIHVQQCDKPTHEEVMRVQKKYIEELTWSIFWLVSTFFVLLITDIFWQL